MLASSGFYEGLALLALRALVRSWFERRFASLVITKGAKRLSNDVARSREPRAVDPFQSRPGWLLGGPVTSVDTVLMLARRSGRSSETERSKRSVGTTLKTADSVSGHMAETHECSACAKEFESRDALLRHTYDAGLVD
ncbi:hypothetical protein BRD01_11520 [Halobacteriales archaeon QS_8_65_32]|nr:MAG: hypothetical protein BRD01_11520 [Halobacteriales archaeon QS_8_65_32]